MRVGLVYGGNSVEHEISIITAMQVYEELNKNHQLTNIYLAKDGNFYIGDVLNSIDSYKDLDNVIKQCTKVVFEKIDNTVYLVEKKMFGKKHPIDLAFLALHGASGEDGRIQGFFDIIGLVYTGPSHFGSSTGQDKVITKDVLKAHNINVLDYRVIYDNDDLACAKETVKELGYPVILKPATLGSSVGINIVANESELEEKLTESFQYETKLIVEHKISDFMEVNCSVLGSYRNAQASVLEEVTFEEFFSFDQKYMGGKKASEGMASAPRRIPANISEALTMQAKEVSLKAFKQLNLSGVVRFDLMIYQDTVYINEVNTIPGSLSYYLWEHDGLKRADLYEELIKLAIEKKRILDSKISSYETNVLSSGNFKKGGKKK